MAIEVFNRYENKYLLDDAAYQQFYDRLLEYMEPDDYNKLHPFYSISNLYFDTHDDELIRKISPPRRSRALR
ncbi:MAG: VTC domain-containing protein [Tumebacillaceae bacterium]